jgi:hypothetical protein
VQIPQRGLAQEDLAPTGARFDLRREAHDVADEIGVTLCPVRAEHRRARRRAAVSIGRGTVRKMRHHLGCGGDLLSGSSVLVASKRSRSSASAWPT